MTARSLLSAELQQFLNLNAKALDEHDGLADALVPAQGKAGILRHGLSASTVGMTRRYQRL